MNYDEAKTAVIEVITARLIEAGKEIPPMEETTDLLGGSLPLDSLELAVIVVTMGEITRSDPFASGFVDFRTLGELARLYTN
jgi:hypothetical protein